MATITAVEVHSQEMATQKSRSRRNEIIIGLLFVAPATLITLIFGLLPVIYGLFMSMQSGTSENPTQFVGLGQYVNALGGLAYILALLISILFMFGGYTLLRRAIKVAHTNDERFYSYLIPAIIVAPALLAVLVMTYLGNYTALLIPAIALATGIGLYVYLSANAKHKDGLLYSVNSLGAVLLIIGGLSVLLYTLYDLNRLTEPLLSIMRQVITAPKDSRYKNLIPLVTQYTVWGAMILFGAVYLGLGRVRRRLPEEDQRRALIQVLRYVALLITASLFLYILAALDLTRGAVIALGSVKAEAIAQFTSLNITDFVASALIWPHVATVILGASLIGIAYLVWIGATRRETNLGTFGTLLTAVFLMIGGWLFIGELPNVVTGGDPNFYQALLRTLTYAIVTVPSELVIGLLLAYLLFHEVKWGKSFYRVVFFIPYVAPTVATATVFAIIFDLSANGFANQILHLFGIPAQEWLRDPRGIFEIIASGGRRSLTAPALPSFLVGPSLPLVSAMLFGIWVFSGYNAVIFLAGLGAVPKDVFEAAQVDGAGRWAGFRYITLPLISPTTFFLTILAIIGTFQAFTHIYVLRYDGTRDAMNTALVYIYEIIRKSQPSRQYAAALSFILFGVIFIMTMVQTRVSRDQVFYG